MSKRSFFCAAFVLAAHVASAQASQPEWRNWDAGAAPRVSDGGVPAAPAPTPQQSILETMMQQQQQMQAELRELRDLVERQGHELEILKKAQKDTYADTDRRLRVFEQAGGAPQATTPASAPAASATESGSSSAPPAADEQGAYDQAFALLKGGKYDQAIKAFDGFVKGYPASANVPNAQYWSGEARYVQGDLKGAMTQFESVVRNAPAHPKVPDALLKIGYLYYDQKNFARAREVLSKVKAQFPGSQAANLSDQRLKRMQQEGV
ncbi:MAG: tol-pal system protein YbgF [Pseudomonadota bacterium]